MLEIRLFGSGRLQYCECPVVVFPDQLPMLLFSYLILNRGRPQGRECLAAVFWGESTSQSARNSLRNTLWRLRQNLHEFGIPVEKYLVVEKDWITFMPTDPFRLDVEQFDQATTPCLEIPGQNLSSLQVNQLEEAISLYTGDLLTGVYEDWCLYERERFRLVQHNILSKLLVYYGMMKTFTRGIICGKRLLALDKTSEKTYQQMMWLYWMSGDHCSAIAQYKLCRQILREEMGIGPMPETRRLYEEMVKGQFDPLHWLDHSEAGALEVREDARTLQPMLERIYAELHRLQSMIEESREESRLIENLISGTWRQ